VREVQAAHRENRERGGAAFEEMSALRGKVEQTLTAPAIQFKGTGWYVTDYAGKKSAGSDSAPAAKSDSSESKDSRRRRLKRRNRRPRKAKTRSRRRRKIEGIL